VTILGHNVLTVLLILYMSIIKFVNNIAYSNIFSYAYINKRSRNWTNATRTRNSIMNKLNTTTTKITHCIQYNTTLNDKTKTQINKTNPP